MYVCIYVWLGAGCDVGEREGERRGNGGPIARPDEQEIQTCPYSGYVPSNSNALASRDKK